MKLNSQLLILVLVAAFTATSWSQASKAQTKEIPTFKMRVRVAAMQGAPPSGKTFQFSFKTLNGITDIANVVTSTDAGWSDWIIVGREQIKTLAGGYEVPRVVAYLFMGEVVDPTLVEAQVSFDENKKTTSISAEMFDKILCLLVHRDEKGNPVVESMVDYNKRYIIPLKAAAIPESDRPKQFRITDAPCGDQNIHTWRGVIPALRDLGINTCAFSGVMPKASLLSELGIHQIAIINPALHSAYVEFGERRGAPKNTSPDTMEAWAKGIMGIWTKWGYEPKQMVQIALRDEGVYTYPEVVDFLKADPQSMARFHAYLQKQGLTPQDLGHQKWDEVKPVGRAVQTGKLPQRRLFYWTTRFMAWDSSRYMGAETAALEKVFQSNPSIYHNTHVFGGRLYTPGPSGGFWKHVGGGDWSPESAMGSNDWFEHARLRGTNTLWTEDWFPDSNAPEWSYYASRLNSAAKKGGLKFGSYVVVRKTDTPNGLLRKAMAIIAHGGKELYWYCFGPNYIFPDGYNDVALEKPHVFKEIGATNQLIGRAEDLLYPGKSVSSPIAIVYPRTSFIWDRHVGDLQNLMTAQSSGWNYGVDYHAEMRGIFWAFQNSAIQPEFIEEDDLTIDHLAKYKVIYVSQPNIPAEHQEALVKWTQSGGTLVKVSNTGTADRYDEPTKILSTLGGIEEAPRQRFYTGPTTPELPRSSVGTIKDSSGNKAQAMQVRGKVTRFSGTVEARFEDDSPAMINAPVGSGRLIHFAFMPGFSYCYSGANHSATIYAGPMPDDLSETLRQWLIRPIQLAGIKLPVEVSKPFIEAPVLESSAGSAITLLNWKNKAAGTISVRYRAPFNVKRVNSAKTGDLNFSKTEDGIIFSLALDAVDVIRVYRSD